MRTRVQSHVGGLDWCGFSIAARDVDTLCHDIFLRANVVGMKKQRRLVGRDDIQGYCHYITSQNCPFVRVVPRCGCCRG